MRNRQFWTPIFLIVNGGHVDLAPGAGAPRSLDSGPNCQNRDPSISRPPFGCRPTVIAWSFWKIFADEARIIYSQAHRRPRASWRVEVGQARGICGPISITHRGS